jgi:hypothetical protein
MPMVTKRLTVAVAMANAGVLSSVAVTAAVFVKTVPETSVWLTVTTMVALTLFPACTMPIPQLTRLDTSAHETSLFAALNVALAGNVSLIRTPEASDGPVAVNHTVYVSGSPANTMALEASLRIVTLVLRWIVVEADALAPMLDSVEVTLAVFATTVPLNTDESTNTVKVRRPVSLIAIVAALHVALKLTMLHAKPGVAALLNVPIDDGSASWTVTLWAMKPLMLVIATT